MLRKHKRYAPVAVLAAALAGCLAGCTSATSTVYAAAPASKTPTTLAKASVPASGLATAPVSASPSAVPLLGLLPVPSGATPWQQNANALLSRVAFVQHFYAKSAWTQEEGLYAARGYVSGAYEGWFLADGSEQSVAIIQFASPAGAVSQFDELTTTLKDHTTTSSQVVSDPADGGLGTINPTPDSLGNAVVELVTHLGDYVIDAHEYVPITPRLTAAKALLLEQYQSFKNSHPGIA